MRERPESDTFLTRSLNEEIFGVNRMGDVLTKNRAVHTGYISFYEFQTNTGRLLLHDRSQRAAMLCVRESELWTDDWTYPTSHCRVAEDFRAHASWDDTQGDRFARLGEAEGAQPGEPVVVDRLWGIEWTACPGGTTGEQCTSGSPVSTGLSSTDDVCQGLVWGSGTAEERGAWRLPEPREVWSLSGYDRKDEYYNDAVQAQFPFLSGVQDSPSVLATAGTRTDSRTRWTVLRRGALVENESGSARVYCVRDRVDAPSREIYQCLDTTAWSSVEPIVTDSAAGLIWQGCLAGRNQNDCGGGTSLTGSWESATEYCQNLNWSALDGWRLPTLAEVAGITNQGGLSISPTRMRQNIDVVAFPQRNIPAQMWVSDQRLDPETDVLTPLLSTGEMRTSGNHQYRCVRDSR